GRPVDDRAEVGEGGGQGELGIHPRARGGGAAGRGDRDAERRGGAAGADLADGDGVPRARREREPLARDRERTGRGVDAGDGVIHAGDDVAHRVRGREVDGDDRAVDADLERAAEDAIVGGAADVVELRGGGRGDAEV